MPRKRNKENAGFPKRWRLIHNAIYYQVPKDCRHQWDGKSTFRLGKTPPEAYKTWAERIGHIDDAKTVSDLLDRYALEVIPKKAAATQHSNHKEIIKLRPVFGGMPLNTVKPRHIYQYLDKRKAKTRGRREISLLSHAFTKAVGWGYIDRHPFKGETELPGEVPRDRYIEDWEMDSCLNIPAPNRKGGAMAVQAYIKLKNLTGLRRADLLRLTMSHLTDIGIKVKTSKKKKAVVFKWTEELRAAVDQAKEARPVNISPWLFCNRRGLGYLNEETGEATGWDSMWHRFMARVMAETEVMERFTEHDIRAKAGSDAETDERASELLTHSSVAITRRVYRRKERIISPLR